MTLPSLRNGFGYLKFRPAEFSYGIKLIMFKSAELTITPACAPSETAEY